MRLAEMESMPLVHVFVCPTIQYVLSIAAGSVAEGVDAAVPNKTTANNKGVMMVVQEPQPGSNFNFLSYCAVN